MSNSPPQLLALRRCPRRWFHVEKLNSCPLRNIVLGTDAERIITVVCRINYLKPWLTLALTKFLILQPISAFRARIIISGVGSVKSCCRPRLFRVKDNAILWLGNRAIHIADWISQPQRSFSTLPLTLYKNSISPKTVRSLFKQYKRWQWNR